jgi:hypothetical protein
MTRNLRAGSPLVVLNEKKTCTQEGCRGSSCGKAASETSLNLHSFGRGPSRPTYGGLVSRRLAIHNKTER